MRNSTAGPTTGPGDLSAGEEIVSRLVNVGTSRLDPPGITLDVAEVYGGRTP